MVRLFFFFISTLVIIGTLFTILRTTVWWVRIFDFPRLQVLIIAFCCICYFSIIGDFANYYILIVQSLLIVSFLYQGIRIFPYTPMASKLVQIADSKHNKEDQICVLISNVFMDNRKSNLLKKVVKKADPDVILLLETNKWWEKELSEFKASHPYHKLCPLENTYGLLFYSKLKLIDTEIKYRVEDDIPSIETKIVLSSGKIIQFYGVHPKPPSPQESLDTTERDAELILVGKEAKKCKLPIIVAGDLNDVAWSHSTMLFQRISGLLDPRIGRGMFSTFNAHYPLLRWPLDHVFHSADFKLGSINRLASINSDHFPICIHLCLSETGKMEQESPVADNEDRKEAAEKVEEAEELKVNH